MKANLIATILTVTFIQVLAQAATTTCEISEHEGSLLDGTSVTTPIELKSSEQGLTLSASGTDSSKRYEYRVYLSEKEDGGEVNSMAIRDTLTDASVEYHGAFAKYGRASVSMGKRKSFMKDSTWFIGIFCKRK